MLRPAYRSGYLAAEDVLAGTPSSFPGRSVFEFSSWFSSVFSAGLLGDPLVHFTDGLSRVAGEESFASLALAALFDGHRSDPVLLRSLKFPARLALCCAFRTNYGGIDDLQLANILHDLMDQAPQNTELLDQCVACLQECFDAEVLRSTYAAATVPPFGETPLNLAIRRLGARTDVGEILPDREEYARLIADVPCASMGDWSADLIAAAAFDSRHDGASSFATHLWTVYVPWLYRSRLATPLPSHVSAALDADVPLQAVTSSLVASAVVSGYDPRAWAQGLDVGRIAAMMDCVDDMLALAYRAAACLPPSIMMDVARRAGWPASLIVFYAEYADDCRAEM